MFVRCYEHYTPSSTRLSATVLMGAAISIINCLHCFSSEATHWLGTERGEACSSSPAEHVHARYNMSY